MREVKPDIVLIYSDGEFGRTPLKLLKALPPTEKTPAERIQLLNALCWYISKQGVKRENIKAFCTSLYRAPVIENLAKDSLAFIDEVVEREIINRARTPKFEMER